MLPDLFPEVRSHPEDDPDSRYTPRGLVMDLHAKHRFTVDAASAADAPSSEVIGRFWTRADDGLSKVWTGERVFCNPPWSDVRPWVAKAWAGAELAVLLLPAWTDRRWWQELVEPYRDWSRFVYHRVEGGPSMRLRTRFLPRMPFGHPGNPDPQNIGQPNFWTVLCVWEPS